MGTGTNCSEELCSINHSAVSIIEADGYVLDSGGWPIQAVDAKREAAAYTLQRGLENSPGDGYGE